MRRYHLLDRLPFHSRALFQMEAWGLAEGYMDYETAVLWYSR
jgi:cell division protein FtsB